ncbi:MAG: hypothetical protein AB7E29_09990 [Xanthobacter sp.]
MMPSYHRHMCVARYVVLTLLIAFGPWLGAGAMSSWMEHPSAPSGEMAFADHVLAGSSGEGCPSCRTHENGAADEGGACSSMCQQICQSVAILSASTVRLVLASPQHDFQISAHPESVVHEVAAPPPRMAT